MSSPPVLVIGAGPAGLATCACLSRAGVPFQLIDREGLAGGAYRRLYPSIELASPARWISLPGLALQAPGEYVTVAQYSGYLQAYAQHFDLAPERATVTSVLPRGAQGFEVAFAGGGSRFYRAVVTATGLDRTIWPECAPREPFTPQPGDGPRWLHSRDWQGPAMAQGCRLLVVGRGVGAVEIAEEAVRAGVTTTVSCRGRVRFGPRKVLGRDVHDFAYLFTWLPRWLARGYCRRSPTFTGYDQGFGRFLQEGRLRVLGPLHSFHNKEALFEDGHREEFDLVVCATGYRFALPYLPPDIARSPDDGHPLGNRGESSSHPGLYLMGVHCSRGVTSQFLRGIALDAPAVAESVRKRLLP